MWSYSAFILVLLGTCYTTVNSVYEPGWILYDRLRPYHPLVQEFASGFIDGISSVPKYFNAFALQQLTCDEATQLLKDIVYERHLTIGDRDAEFSSITVSNALKVNFDVATNLYIIESVAYSAGEHLFQSRVLSEINVSKLSKQLLNIMKKELDAVVGEYACAETNFRAIKNGLIKFLSKYGLFNKNNAFAFAGTLASVIHLNRL